jgi:ABC-type antimicrobial peptide transport system permease subunit
MRQTVWILVGGAVLGLVLAVPASRLIANQLFGVQSFDLATVAAVLAVLTTVACLAGYLPARRAARLNPTHALRYE